MRLSLLSSMLAPLCIPGSAKHLAVLRNS